MSTTPIATRDEPIPARTDGAGTTVARNALFLVGGQLLGMPLSLAVAAVMARRLGAEDFGYLYLAGTLVSFGFLLVEWGQGGTLPSLIARDPSRAGALLGSGLAWRAASALPVYGSLVLVAWGLGQGARLQLVLALVVVARVFGTIAGAVLDAARGLENTRLSANSQVRYNVLCAALIIPGLWLGGQLLFALLALAAADVLNTLLVLRSARSLGFGKLGVRAADVRTELVDGVPFMVLGLALALQPNVDATLLAKLGTAAAVGWHAAARKLIGVMVFPVNAICGSLYPTLCRLHTESRARFRELLRTTLQTSVLLAMPIALGCWLYADIGVQIFSKSSFEPARDNLRILSLFLFLLYFSMILGTGIIAAGRQKAWTLTQFACVLVSALADPFLIPWFQRRAGNGGLGVCVSAVFSEVLMVAVGLALAPAGLIDRVLLRSFAAAVAAALAMVAVAVGLSRLQLNSFLAAPISVAAYAAALRLTGQLDRDKLQVLRSLLKKDAGDS